MVFFAHRKAVTAALLLVSVAIALGGGASEAAPGIQATDPCTTTTTVSIDEGEDRTFLITVDPASCSATGGSGTEVSKPNAASGPAGIIVDGAPGDWAGIDPLITDPLGDTVTEPGRLDFVSLKVTDDGTNVYFLQELAENATMCCSFLLLDTDLDLFTGCFPGNIGAEYIVAFNPGGVSSLGDHRDCSSGPLDFPGALTVAVSGPFIEASVPIATLEVLTPTLEGFDIVTHNDFSQRSTYMLKATMAVGGISRDAELRPLPLETTAGSGSSPWAIAAGVAAVCLLALGGAAWYARRRRAVRT